MNILLTGGSGFIGKNVIEALSGRYRFFAPRHSELDLTDEERVAEFFGEHHIDVVIHSAVKPGHRNSADLTGLFYSNTRMFFNLVKNSRRFGRMIFLSSGLVYDHRHYVAKMTEEYFDTHVPADEAGFSKYVSAKYIERSEGIVELRPFGVFGKYEDYAIRFLSNLICKAIFGLPLTMKQNRRFDYIFIDDFVEVLDYFIRNEGKYKAYNITPDKSVELVALAEKIRLVSGKDLPIRVAKDGMGSEYSGDNRRLREEIPQLRLTPIDEAIKKLYEWYSDHKAMINEDLLRTDK